MKILVTGSSGMIGQVVCQELQNAEHETVAFDSARGQNILDSQQLHSAMNGCNAVVHLAALLGDEHETAQEIMSVNLLGTWQVLQAAQAANVQRVIGFSSLEALGIFRGERAPDYLPIDDAHPCYPQSPYALSKLLAEVMCQHWTNRSGIASLCLRLPGVFTAETYNFIRQARRDNPEFEWFPFWQYGAFLDVRDAASAALCALTCEFSGHATLNLCADDISSALQNSRDLARLVCPDVEWHGGAEYETEPFKALVDNRRAKETLGWSPRYKWRH